MPRQPSVPSYRLHKNSGQAIVTIRLTSGGRRDVYLGEFNSPESRKEYARVIAELTTSQVVSVAPTPSQDATVDELLLGFMRWANTHYRDQDKQPTTEINELKASLTPLRRLYGHTTAKNFGPKALVAVRGEMVAAGWCRTVINRRIDRVKRAFRWAASEELVPVTVYTALRTVAGLARGRTEVRESAPVLPVDPEHVAATLPHMNPHVRAMVELQTLTGMRPGEVRRLTVAEVDRQGGLWWYRPDRHKTSHRGKRRAIAFGPRAQAVVVAFLVGDKPPPNGFDGIDLVNDHTARLVAADAFEEAGRIADGALLRDLSRRVVFVGGCVVDPLARLFSPAQEREERFRQMRTRRKSKVQPSQESRKKKFPKRRPGTSYSATTYANAISRACDKAGVPHWHPNQLRHTFATSVRKAHGLEAAQVLLGHSRADVTQVYAERDETLAASVAAKIG